MALAVNLVGLNEFGGELWRTEPFWWNAGAVQDELGDRLKPLGRDTWGVLLPPDEVIKIAVRNPVRFDHHLHHTEKLLEMLKAARIVKLSIYEWGFS